jgi:spore germination protein GerM
MTRRAVIISAIAFVAIVAGAWLLGSRFSDRSVSNGASANPAAAATTPAAAAKITATLYFISEDGMWLVGVQREVPFGETVLEQARQIINGQLGGAPGPLASPVPTGTALRTLYLTDRGDAFVDLSVEARTKHTGGALDELFTVYSIVNALTTNLPAVTRVQILIEGKEVDTLAGHVDLRHPLLKNMKWVRMEKGQT